MSQSIEGCIEQRELGYDKEKISPLETLTSWGRNLEKLDESQNWTRHRKTTSTTHPTTIYKVFPKSVAIEGRQNKIFLSTTKATKIMVEGGLRQWLCTLSW
jgi:hypothetical protein